MDPVTADSHRAALRNRLEETRGVMHRAASAAVLKGDPLAQQMEALAETIGALAAFHEGADLDGIAYRSRHDNRELCFALFDRVTSADFGAGSTRLFNEQPHICDSLMLKYGAAYDNSLPIPPP